LMRGNCGHLCCKTLCLTFEWSAGIRVTGK
jgi:hypothetical protein